MSSHSLINICHSHHHIISQCFFLKTMEIKNGDSSLDSDGEIEIRIFLYFASIYWVHRQPHLKMRISPADRQNCMITRHLQKKISNEKRKVCLCEYNQFFSPKMNSSRSKTDILHILDIFRSITCFSYILMIILDRLNKMADY